MEPLDIYQRKYVRYLTYLSIGTYVYIQILFIVLLKNYSDIETTDIISSKCHTTNSTNEYLCYSSSKPEKINQVWIYIPIVGICSSLLFMIMFAIVIRKVIIQ